MTGKINNDHFEHTLLQTIKADLFRITGSTRMLDFLSAYARFAGFRYIFWMRLTAFSRKKRLFRIFHYPARIILYRLQQKFGINIAYNTKIKPGFYIGHYGGIVVHCKVEIGWNCNISHGVTLGISSRGVKAGVPQIGNNVYIGPGAVVIGNIKVGDNSAIGANCVVTKDVPENAVVAGVPGKIVSYKGSDGYICNTVPTQS